MKPDEIRTQAAAVTEELLTQARLEAGDIVVVGCSSSEVTGCRIGTASSTEAAEAILDGIYPLLTKRGIWLAAQCCEHLNRALIIENELRRILRLPRLNAVPQPKAGGSFASACYRRFQEPAAVEHIQAQAGMDIGGTLIGMHLQEVAVPLRLSQNHIGDAILLCARTRPKFTGGSRAVYDEKLL